MGQTIAAVPGGGFELVETKPAEAVKEVMVPAAHMPHGVQMVRAKDGGRWRYFAAIFFVAPEERQYWAWNGPYDRREIDVVFEGLIKILKRPCDCLECRPA